MRITCPACFNAAELDRAELPFGTLVAKCPKCGCDFSFRRNDENQPAAEEIKKYAPPANAEKPRASAPQTDTAASQARSFTPSPSAPSQDFDSAPADVKTFIDAKVTFFGKGTTLFSLYAVNFFLTIITLGVYYAWGKVKVRKYIYGSLEFSGDRFEFTGNGKEIFYGLLKSLPIVGVLIFVPQALAELVDPRYILLLYLGIYIITPIAKVSGRKYRYTRTTWHGAQFSFRGTILQGLALYIKGAVLTLVTLGLYYPVFYIEKETFYRTNTFYGTSQFKYSGKTRDIYLSMVIAGILIPITFGWYWYYIAAKLARYNADNTSVQNLRFKSSVTGGNYFNYAFGNQLLLIFTLGLGYPWYIRRKVDFLVKYLSLNGTIDFAQIRQTPNTASAIGEGFLDQLDLDMGI